MFDRVLNTPLMKAYNKSYLLQDFDEYQAEYEFYCKLGR